MREFLFESSSSQYIGIVRMFVYSLVRDTHVHVLLAYSIAAEVDVVLY